MSTPGTNKCYRCEFHQQMGITLLDAKWLDPECHKGCKSLVFKNRIAQLERELGEARKHTKTCQSCHSIGIQLDMIRDELKRIEARILESEFSEDPRLVNILEYCRRSQRDIPTFYSVIGERDRLEAENLKLRIKADDQRTALEKAWKVFKDPTKESQIDSESEFQQYVQDWDDAKAAINEVLEEPK